MHCKIEVNVNRIATRIQCKIEVMLMLGRLM